MRKSFEIVRTYFSLPRAEKFSSPSRKKPKLYSCLMYLRWSAENGGLPILRKQLSHSPFPVLSLSSLLNFSRRPFLSPKTFPPLMKIPMLPERLRSTTDYWAKRAKETERLDVQSSCFPLYIFFFFFFLSPPLSFFLSPGEGEPRRPPPRTRKTLPPISLPPPPFKLIQLCPLDPAAPALLPPRGFFFSRVPRPATLVPHPPPPPFFSFSQKGLI